LPALRWRIGSVAGKARPNRTAPTELETMAMRLLTLQILLIFLLAGAAYATPFAPQVDFRTGGVFVPPGAVDTHTAPAAGTTITIQAYETNGGVLSPAGLIYWDSEDGYGIRALSYEDDEIEFPEVLGISFAATTYVERFLLSDLFIEDGYTEQGSYSLDGGTSWTNIFADGLHSNGEVELTLGANIDEILFAAPGIVGNQDHEFSVAGFDGRINVVPEPGAALVFGVGFLIVGHRVRGIRR
jgi:hypothetical protein